MEKKQASSMEVVDQKNQILLINQAGTTSENRRIPWDKAQGFEANGDSPQSDPSAEERAHPKRLAPGVLFRPQDSVLILHYLNRKIRGEPLPDYCDFIREVEFYKHDPEELTTIKHENVKDEWYFFTQRERIGEKAVKRDTAYGTWRSVHREREIKDQGGRLIGYKRPLEYLREGKKTEWLMTEYSTLEPQRPVNPRSDSKLLDTVLCRVYRSPRAGRTGIPDLNHPLPRPGGNSGGRSARPSSRKLHVHPRGSSSSRCRDFCTQDQESREPETNHGKANDRGIQQSATFCDARGLSKD